eukprot:PhF_6_TR23852/c0_g1_i1/m.33440
MNTSDESCLSRYQNIRCSLNGFIRLSDVVFCCVTLVCVLWSPRPKRKHRLYEYYSMEHPPLAVYLPCSILSLLCFYILESGLRRAFPVKSCSLPSVWPFAVASAIGQGIFRMKNTYVEPPYHAFEYSLVMLLVMMARCAKLRHWKSCGTLGVLCILGYATGYMSTFIMFLFFAFWIPEAHEHIGYILITPMHFAVLIAIVLQDNLMLTWGLLLFRIRIHISLTVLQAIVILHWWSQRVFSS